MGGRLTAALDELEERRRAGPPITCAEAAARTAEAFKVGDVVTLRSGGQPMTVVTTGCQEVYTVWFDQRGLQDGDFPPAALKAATPMDEEFPF